MTMKPVIAPWTKVIFHQLIQQQMYHLNTRTGAPIIRIIMLKGRQRSLKRLTQGRRVRHQGCLARYKYFLFHENFPLHFYLKSYFDFTNFFDRLRKNEMQLKRPKKDYKDQLVTSVKNICHHRGYLKIFPEKLHIFHKLVIF